MERYAAFRQPTDGVADPGTRSPQPFTVGGWYDTFANAGIGLDVAGATRNTACGV